MGAENFFCAAESKTGNDELIGTATYFKNLLLIEYRQPFKQRAFEESELPEAVKNKLQLFLHQNKFTKPLLIRKPEAESGELAVFGVINNGKQNSIKRKLISSYTELVDYDLNELFSDNSDIAYNEFMYLVCTNGTKDKCCAKFGIPIYNEFKKQREANTWQCTHLGGDRFAPTLLALPSCSNYGHVVTEDVEHIISCEENNQLFLDKLRGQAFMNAFEQAAVFFLRKKINEININAIELFGSKRADANKVVVALINTVTGGQYLLTVSQQASAYFNYLNCAAPKQSHSGKFHLDEFKEVVSA